MNSEIDALSSTADGRELENKKFMLEIKESDLEPSETQHKNGKSIEKENSRGAIQL